MKLSADVNKLNSRQFTKAQLASMVAELAQILNSCEEDGSIELDVWHLPKDLVQPEFTLEIDLTLRLERCIRVPDTNEVWDWLQQAIIDRMTTSGAAPCVLSDEAKDSLDSFGIGSSSAERYALADDLTTITVNSITKEG